MNMEHRKKAAEMTVKELASYIDQSVLKPEFTQEDIRRYIQEGIDYGWLPHRMRKSSISGYSCRALRGLGNQDLRSLRFPLWSFHHAL